ncbi:hypothetical protein ACEPAG_3457 [Sanghuangporus baumii]
MESVVARIGDQLHHPILLGHAVIRLERTVTPFLKAILNQVNGSMMSGKQIAEASSEVTDRYLDFEEVADSDISVEVAVKSMFFNRDKCETAAPIISEQSIAASVGSAETATPTSSTTCNESVGLSQHAARLIDSVLHKKGTSGTSGENLQPDEQSAFPVSAIPCNADFARTPNEPIVSQPEVIIDHGLQTPSSEDTPRRQRRMTEKALALNIFEVFTKGRIGTYECVFCDKKFKQKSGLRDHMNTHTGETHDAVGIPETEPRTTSSGELMK